MPESSLLKMELRLCVSASMLSAMLFCAVDVSPLFTVVSEALPAPCGAVDELVVGDESLANGRVGLSLVPDELRHAHKNSKPRKGIIAIVFILFIKPACVID
jgi:hypothetical protein